jgi:nitrogen fixation NifU-like protein
MSESRTAGEAANGDAPGNSDPYFGRMNDPTGSAFVRGLCGEEMEFYLYIRGGVIEDVKYYTQGCETTRSCARAVAQRTKGRTVVDVLALNPKEIIDAVSILPAEDRHCAILAVGTFHRAIANFLLTP